MLILARHEGRLAAHDPSTAESVHHGAALWVGVEHDQGDESQNRRADDDHGNFAASTEMVPAIAKSLLTLRSAAILVLGASPVAASTIGSLANILPGVALRVLIQTVLHANDTTPHRAIDAVSARSATRRRRRWVERVEGRGRSCVDTGTPG